MNETDDGKFTELFPPASGSDERTVLSFERGVDSLGLTPLAVEISV